MLLDEPFCALRDATFREHVQALVICCGVNALAEE
jgi:ABC-type taurine transport system ATPase subunit